MDISRILKMDGDAARDPSDAYLFCKRLTCGIDRRNSHFFLLIPVHLHSLPLTHLWFTNIKGPAKLEDIISRCDHVVTFKVGHMFAFGSIAPFDAVRFERLF